MRRAALTGHPFESLTRNNRRLLLWISGIASVLVGGTIWVVTLPLQTASAPLGLLSLELAGQPFIVRSILANWAATLGAEGTTRAAFCTGLGALFAIATWAFFSALCLAASDGIRSAIRILTGAGRALAWAQFAALAAAVAEEVLLLKLLGDGGAKASVGLATRYCAEAKYAILLAGGFYPFLCYYIDALQKLRVHWAVSSANKTESSKTMKV